MARVSRVSDRAKRLGEEKFRQVFEQIVRQCIEKGLVKGKQIIDSKECGGVFKFT